MFLIDWVNNMDTDFMLTVGAVLFGIWVIVATILASGPLHDFVTYDGAWSIGMFIFASVALGGLLFVWPIIVVMVVALVSIAIIALPLAGMGWIIGRKFRR